MCPAVTSGRFSTGSSSRSSNGNTDLMLLIVVLSFTDTRSGFLSMFESVLG